MLASIPTVSHRFLAVSSPAGARSNVSKRPMLSPLFAKHLQQRLATDQGPNHLSPAMSPRQKRQDIVEVAEMWC